MRPGLRTEGNVLKAEEDDVGARRENGLGWGKG